MRNFDSYKFVKLDLLLYTTQYITRIIDEKILTNFNSWN